jgi:hypothetical protein
MPRETLQYALNLRTLSALLLSAGGQVASAARGLSERLND